VDEADASSDARLGHLLRAVAEPEPLSASALSEVHLRLHARRSSAGANRRMREVLLATVMLLAGSSLALAGWGVEEWWQARSRPPIASTPTRAAATSHAPRTAPAQGVAHETASAQVESIPDAQIEVESKTSDAATVEHPVTRPAASAASTLAAETEALARVLVLLRREHDARSALAALDQSQSLLEHGTLSLEARVARVDALLQLGRRAEALEILDHLPFTQVGRGGELRLMRAELRAADDCGRALVDFDALVTQSLSANLSDRAFYGRAACELRLGDDAHAERDFNQYLARFPQGRFATEVRAQLSKLTAKAH